MKIDEAMQSIINAAPQYCKEKLRNLKNGFMEALSKLENIDKFEILFDLLYSFFNTLEKANKHIQQTSFHITNVEKLFKFSTFVVLLLTNIENDFTDDMNGYMFAFINSAVQINSFSDNQYSLLIQKTYQLGIPILPCVYVSNFYYRERLLLPFLRLTKKYIKIFIFTSDDIADLYENSIWFAHNLLGATVFDNYTDFSQNFNNIERCLVFLSPYGLLRFVSEHLNQELRHVTVIYRYSGQPSEIFQQMTELLKFAHKELGMTYVISSALHISIENVVVTDYSQLNNIFTYSNECTEIYLEMAISDCPTRVKTVVYVETLERALQLLKKIKPAKRCILDPDLSIYENSNVIRERFEQSCISNITILPIFTCFQSNCQLINSVKPSQGILLIFVLGNYCKHICNVHIAIDETADTIAELNICFLSKYDGTPLDYIITCKKRSCRRLFNGSSFSTQFKKYLDEREISCENEPNNEGDYEVINEIPVIPSFILFLQNHTHIFEDPWKKELVALVNIDSDVITIMRCFSQVMQANLIDRFT